MNPGFLVRSALASLFALMVVVLPANPAHGQEPSIVVRYLGMVETTSERLHVQPETILATTAANVMVFNPASVGVSAGSAQTLTASFSVSGYSGSFTPTANLHYGRDYTLGTVSCSGGGPETCNVPVIFQPTLPGVRRDAIFLSDGSGTRLATVLLAGIGQAPLALVQPGSIVSDFAPTPSYYNYNNTVDENGTVYSVTSNATGSILQVDKTGTQTWLPITGNHTVGNLGMNGAGILYFNINGYGDHLLTYDTVQGTQGSLSMVPPSYTPCPFATLGPGDYLWYFAGVAVDMSGNVYGNEILCNVIIEHKIDGTFATYPISPAITQPYELAVDASGNLFPGGYTIDEIVPGGASTQVNAVGATDGIAVDAADSLYPTRYLGSDLPGGVALLPASNYSTDTAGFDTTIQPLGLGLASDGTIFVGNYTQIDKVDRSQGLLDFSTISVQSIGSTSSILNTGIYNGGNVPLTIADITVNGAVFTAVASASNGCTAGMTLAPGALCALDVTATPTQGGVSTGSIVFTTNSLNASSMASNVALKAIAAGPNISAAPAALDFGNLAAGSTSPAQIVTLTDSGYDAGAPPSIHPATVPPGFAVDTSNCSGLVAGGASATCTVPVTFSPTATTSYLGTVSIPYTATGLSGTHSVTFTVTGNGGTSNIGFSPATIPFGSLDTGLQSPATTVTVSNSGTAPLHISAIALTGANPSQFGILAGGSCTTSTPVAVGGSCTILVDFAPTTSGNDSASLTLTDDAPASPQSVALTGTGTAPLPVSTISPTSVTFGNQVVNTTSSPQTVTLTNSGSAALTITSIALTGANSGSFALTNNCPASLAVGVSCNIVVTFTPATIASFSASITVTDNASGSPHTVALSGAGIAAAPIATLTPASLNFASVGTGSTSAAQVATLKNTGNAALTIGSIAITGANATNFAQTNSCGASLAAGASCAISVTFKPASIASFTAQLTVTDNATGSPHKVALSGTGIAPSPVLTISPTSIAFGNQVINTISSSKTVTLTNTSTTDTVTISSVTSSNTAFYASGSCPATIAPGASCQLIMVFQPEAVQPFSAIVTLQIAGVSCLACSYPAQTFTVTGTGLPVMSVSPTTLDFGNQPINRTSARKTVTLTNASTKDTVVEWSFGTSDSVFTPYIAGCIAPIPPGGSCTVAIDFTPTAIQSYSATASFQMKQAACGGPCATYPVQTFAITGAGVPVPPVMSVSPTTLDFGSQFVNTISTRKTVTLTNTSATDTVVEWSFDTGNPVFASYIGGCVAPIPPGGKCIAEIDFTPSAAQSYSATASFQMKQAACGGSCLTYPVQTFTITGTGIARPSVTLSPSPLDFGNVAVHSVANQLFTVTNAGPGSLTISGIKTPGSPGFVAEFGSCFAPAPIAAGSSCTIDVAFQPSGAGYVRGTLAITDDGAGSPQTVDLSGTGVAPVVTLSPSPLDFGNVEVGTIANQSVTLNNAGPGALTITNIGIIGGAAFTAGGGSCPLLTAIAAGSSCTINVTFLPNVAGAFAGTLTVTDDGAVSPQAVSLSGTGSLIPAFIISSPTPPQVIMPGGSAQFSLTVTAQQGVTIPAVSLSATGLPPGATAVFSQSAVTPGSTSATATLTIKTSNKSAAVTGSAWPLAAPVLALAGLLFIPARRRGYWASLGVLTLVLLSSLAALSGCGGGFNMLPPLKSYDVTIIGTVGTVQQTTTVQLTVQ